MLRQLLTILAVFTGLTAAVEPARALEASVARVEMSEQQRVCNPLVTAHGETATMADAVEAQPMLRAMPDAVPSAPTIVLQVDRAHE